MLLEDRFVQITQRFEFLEACMADMSRQKDYAEVSQEYSELKPIVDQIKFRKELMDNIVSTQEMLSDPEFRSLAEEEIRVLKSRLSEIEKAIQLSLLPRDVADRSVTVVLEIRPGTGGDEAALFASDLLKMYIRYAENSDWTFEIIEEQATELGGFKGVVALVKGKDVYAKMKYESGVHRVQRVPETESGGRIHTSTATVAVLPEIKDVVISIDPNDLRIDTMRASGAGGQHVNKTDSAVRITHIPTGIVVTSSEKSQHRNRAIAMEVMEMRLNDLERQRLHSQRSSDRADQVGSGDRSERIRTYNFPQGRITDHRINLTLYKLDYVLNGNLSEIINALVADTQAQALSRLSL
ncbi:MAG: peptide chain release factor 1 [Aestuariivita sp.]|nr:peptide chain release factor 1 [Aestuariivita sp.]